ncbi:winged helix-turn-helix transcriptional regulator [Halorubellus salinus]|uniref:winged helix-turn-helix transcriptional regulator n=1 Tax=Halorubellus salinus TaxID=755309 RepID=UPI001D095051|nr:winged helix-turn-helix transcriptional regulator [Halorubellus salinus]
MRFRAGARRGSGGEFARDADGDGRRHRTRRCDAGILHREQYDEIPPRVEYALTADGRDLCDAFGPLVEWARERDGSA